MTNQNQGSQRVLEVFISYSHKDEKFRQQLETHLSLLRHKGVLQTWHDRKITAGTEWAGQIDDHLGTADIILLLVSPDFIASSYCWDKEVTKAVSRHDAGQARVIPVILRPVDWQDAPFGKLQALPRDARPVVKWPIRDEAWKDVVDGLRQAARELGRPKTNPAAPEKTPVTPDQNKKEPVKMRPSQPSSPVEQPEIKRAAPEGSGKLAGPPNALRTHVLKAEWKEQPSLNQAAPASTSPALLTIESPIHLELIRIPAGEFLMGSDQNRDTAALFAEHPQQRVYVPDFYIGKYPITNSQYGAFVAAGGRVPEGWRDGASPPGKADHPVVRVNWYDAVAFYQWLSQAAQKSFGLPTEAEWEKAARGTDGRIYPWGSPAPDARRCNFSNYDTAPVWQHPAGASLYGAMDMSGNVWEWCSTKWRDNYQEPVDEALGGHAARVLRGGAFNNAASVMRCAYRGKDNPLTCRDNVGFRIVLSLP